MKKKTHRKKSEKKDVNQIAHDVFARISEIDAGGKNPAAVALGRLGGLKGGKARAASLTPSRRREIAIKAAQKRWPKQF